MKLSRTEQDWTERKTIKADPITEARLAVILYEALHHHDNCEKCQELENRALWSLNEGE